MEYYIEITQDGEKLISAIADIKTCFCIYWSVATSVQNISDDNFFVTVKHIPTGINIDITRGTDAKYTEKSRTPLKKNTCYMIDRVNMFEEYYPERCSSVSQKI